MGEKKEAIKNFAERLHLEINCNFDDEQSVEVWLYESLYNLNPIRRIMAETCGHATSFDKLAEKTFPGVERNLAQKATSALLAIAPLAKNKDKQVLYPARLHMFFRGLHGLFACSNPSCSFRNHDVRTGLGKIFLRKT